MFGYNTETPYIVQAVQNYITLSNMQTFKNSIVFSASALKHLVKRWQTLASDRLQYLWIRF